MSFGLWVLVAIFLGTAVLGAPVGQCMIAAGIGYFLATHQDVGLVVDQTMNGLYNSYLLLAVPLFIFVANVMNASGVIERLLTFAEAMVGRFRGGLAHVNVVANLIFSGMSGSAIADAAGPGLIVARMMMRDGRYPAGFAAATSAVSATIGPLVPPSIAMIFYALIANTSVGVRALSEDQGCVHSGRRPCPVRRSGPITSGAFYAPNGCGKLASVSPQAVCPPPSCTQSRTRAFATLCAPKRMSA